jgi:hypothetical protein
MRGRTAEPNTQWQVTSNFSAVRTDEVHIKQVAFSGNRGE